nr:extracellular solute-binding protein [Ktedonobacteraceae bacterium]
MAVFKAGPCEQGRFQEMWRAGYAAWGLLLVLILLSTCTGPGSTTNQASTPTPGTSAQCGSHSSNPVTLTMYYGSEKQAWIDSVVSDFNSRQATACDGPIMVKALPIGSGLSMQQIANGTIQPDVWSPAGSVWLSLLNAMWREKHGSDLIGTGANDTPSLVSSPVVLAMWKPQAEALGWPGKAIGWADIARLSTDPRGWAAYGHPEFGDFKFGHTHPDYSNSGLDAVIAMHYAAAGKVRGLTTDNVRSQTSRDFVANVESSVIHYGDSTGFFATKMFNNGPGYLSAAVLYESSVIEANTPGKYPHLPFPVVAIYPKEGTFYSDHPYAILHGSWVTPAKQAAAQAFRTFLLAPAQQAKALGYGFRPANASVGLGAPFDSAHGVDPHQPATLLQPPSVDVVRAITASWHELRRKVDVMLILDRSGSMGDSIEGTTKIAGARQGLTEFVGLLSDSDRVGLTVFSDSADIISPVSPLGAKRQDLLTRINGIVPGGNTRLFDTVSDQVKALQALPSKNIKAVIVLTDGMDNQSALHIDQLTR